MKISLSILMIVLFSTQLIQAQTSVPTAVKKEVKNYLKAGEKLNVGEKLYSANGEFMLSMQADGNLCIYTVGCKGEQGIFTWGSWQTLKYDRSNSAEGYQLLMQDDGNLCIYDLKMGFKWGTRQVKAYPASKGCILILTDEGKLTISNSEGAAVWVNL